METIKYNFYKDYEDNKNFKIILQKRLKEIRNRYSVKINDDEELIKEYFVEIFSWSVLTKNIIKQIERILKSHNIFKIIDPCCGNGFHTYLFKEFGDFDVISIDIQKEKESWIDTIEGDGRKYIEKMNKNLQKEYALLLSWIDYEDLCLDILSLYNANILINIGNYEEKCPIYMETIRKNFSVLEKITLHMPWGLTENIEIFYKPM